MDLRICSPNKPIKDRPNLPFFKRGHTFHKLFKGKEAVFTGSCRYSFPCFFMFFQGQPGMRSGQDQSEIYRQFFDIFSLDHQAHEKYHWSLLKINWITRLLLMKKIFQWFIKTKVMTIMLHQTQAG